MKEVAIGILYGSIKNTLERIGYKLDENELEYSTKIIKW